MSDQCVFVLHAIPRLGTWTGTIITPTPIPIRKIQIAWTHAVRYTAKGIDMPDYESAIKRLLEHHPSWTYLGESPAIVHADLQIKDEDKPD